MPTNAMPFLASKKNPTNFYKKNYKFESVPLIFNFPDQEHNIITEFNEYRRDSLAKLYHSFTGEAFILD